MGAKVKFPTTAKYLKEARVKAGLTQDDLGRVCGFKSGHQVISNCERAVCGIPAQYVKPLSKVLKVSIDEMIQWAVVDYYLNYARKAK